MRIVAVVLGGDPGGEWGLYGANSLGGDMVNGWIDATANYQRERGEERYIRNLDANSFVSVLHRRTGFGWMEWESAFVWRNPGEKAMAPGSPLILGGDLREIVDAMPAENVRQWFEDNRANNRTSFDEILEAMREAAQ